MKNIILLLSVFLLMNTACSRKTLQRGLVNLPQQGKSVPIHGKIQIDQNGGHLQGIQMYQENDRTYLYLSGSSSIASFIVKAEIDSQARILSADTLLSDPYRHAGGFQISGRYLAIGIEDNIERNTSRVMVYDLTKEGDLWSDPVQMIRRNGAYERVTAGAVGMTRIHGHYLIAVANWDSRHLDFYICPEDRLDGQKMGFRWMASLEMKGISREKWSDPDWNSYQNINLFTQSDRELFLVGFAANDRGENVADLFRLRINEDLFMPSHQIESKKSDILITKLDSRSFESDSTNSFRWGAGLYRDQNGNLTLLACPEHIDDDTKVVMYGVTSFFSHRG